MRVPRHLEEEEAAVILAKICYPTSVSCFDDGIDLCRGRAVEDEGVLG